MFYAKKVATQTKFTNAGSGGCCKQGSQSSPNGPINFLGGKMCRRHDDHFLRLFAAQGCGVAPLAEDVPVPLMQCPLAGSGRNLFMVLAIARLLFTDTSFTLSLCAIILWPLYRNREIQQRVT